MYEYDVVRIYEFTHVFMSACMYACKHECMYVLVCVHISTYMCECMYVRRVKKYKIWEGHVRQDGTVEVLYGNLR